MNKLGIYIPSLGRWDRQSTLEALASVEHHVHLVVPEEEFSAYIGNIDISQNVSIMPCDESGISATRQEIMDIAIEEYVLMLDDDMKFNVRKDGRLLVASPEEVKEMIDLLVSWLDEGFAHVGISARQGNNRVEEDYVDVARVNNAYAFNVEKFRESGARFDRLPVMEDFDVTLTLLEAGYPNRVTYKYAWGQRQSGDTGGCSTYRNDQMQKEAAFLLKKYHPRVVKVLKKSSKEAWGGFSNNARHDVVIEWKKAYMPRSKNSFLGKFIR